MKYDKKSPMDKCSTIQAPGSNEKEVKDRGPMPPDGNKGRMHAATPWKPKGRKK